MDEIDFIGTIHMALDRLEYPFVAEGSLDEFSFPLYETERYAYFKLCQVEGLESDTPLWNEGANSVVPSTAFSKP